MLVFNVFWDILKTPFTFSKRKLENRLNRGFNFKAEGEIQWFQSAADGSKFIKIEKNTYADVRIAIYFLHYVDKFVTSDLNQAELLVFLLPHYRDKIIFK